MLCGASSIRGDACHHMHTMRMQGTARPDIRTLYAFVRAGLNKSLLSRGRDCCSPRVDAQFVVDAGSMVFDRADGDEEQVSNLRRTVSIGQEGEDLMLALAQLDRCANVAGARLPGGRIDLPIASASAIAIASASASVNGREYPASMATRYPGPMPISSLGRCDPTGPVNHHRTGRRSVRQSPGSSRAAVRSHRTCRTRTPDLRDLRGCTAGITIPDSRRDISSHR